VDQETKGGFSVFEFPYQLSGLLTGPHLIGISSHASQMHSACVQFDEEELIQSLQPDGLHREEDAGQDLLLVMAHQLAPTNGTVANRCW
jgi:hypothetical protein